MTRSATLGQAFSLDVAFSGTIDMSYVLYLQVLHISMLSFTFILRLASAVSLSVRRTRHLMPEALMPPPVVHCVHGSRTCDPIREHAEGVFEA